MTVDITNEQETLMLKAKWTARGVPEALFNAMVNEANAEYNSSIGFEDWSRFSMLTVNIDDENFSNEYFYRIVLNWGGIGIMSRGIAGIVWIFGQVPAITTHIEVFKISNDGTECVGYGYLLFTHTKDEECEVTINPIVTEEKCDIYKKVKAFEVKINTLDESGEIAILSTSVSVNVT